MDNGDPYTWLVDAVIVSDLVACPYCSGNVGVEDGLREVSVRKMMSGSRLLIGSQTSVACLQSERALRRVQASWSCSAGVAGAVVCMGLCSMMLSVLLKMKWQCVQVNGPIVECRVAR